RAGSGGASAIGGAAEGRAGLAATVANGSSTRGGSAGRWASRGAPLGRCRTYAAAPRARRAGAGGARPFPRRLMAERLRNQRTNATALKSRRAGDAITPENSRFHLHDRPHGDELRCGRTGWIRRDLVGRGVPGDACRAGIQPPSSPPPKSPPVLRA